MTIAECPQRQYEIAASIAFYPGRSRFLIQSAQCHLIAQFTEAFLNERPDATPST